MGKKGGPWIWCISVVDCLFKTSFDFRLILNHFFDHLVTSINKRKNFVGVFLKV
jgi:hypothetical protein